MHSIIFTTKKNENIILLNIIRLLKNKSKARDMLIENLHLIQDKFKCLHSKHLTALATIMKMPLAEVYEVASF